MKTELRETDESSAQSGARVAAASRRFDGNDSRAELLRAIERELRDRAGVVELVVVRPAHGGWVPLWWTGAATPDLSAPTIRWRPAALANPIATLPLCVGDRLIAKVIVLAVEASRSGAFDPERVEEFLGEAAFALHQRFDPERPTVRPGRPR